MPLSSLIQSALLVCGVSTEIEDLLTLISLRYGGNLLAENTLGTSPSKLPYLGYKNGDLGKG